MPSIHTMLWTFTQIQFLNNLWSRVRMLFRYCPTDNTPLLGSLGGPVLEDVSVVLYFTRLFSDLIGRPLSAVLCPKFLSTEGTLVSLKNFRLPSFGAVPLNLQHCWCMLDTGPGLRASPFPRFSLLRIHLAHATASTLKLLRPCCSLCLFSAFRGKYASSMSNCWASFRFSSCHNFGNFDSLPLAFV